jgi:hypothetical protein
MSTIFLAMRRTAALHLNPQNRKGAHPLSVNPGHLVYYFDGGAENVITFLNNISQTKNSVCMRSK